MGNPIGTHDTQGGEPMQGNFPKIGPAIAGLMAIIAILALVSVASAYKICTFRGIVIDHGWRSMTVKTGKQCAKVNVGWRTQYIPNRRPCLGEKVAVDFVLEDGYMTATKVVSLTPRPPEKECYPPPPPRSARCKNVPDGDGYDCAPSKPVCSRRPPAYVSDPEKWSPSKKRPPKKRKVRKAKPKPKPKPRPKPKPDPEPDPEPKPEETLTPTPTPPTPEYTTITGEVVSSSPKSMSIRVSGDGGAEELVNIKVGLKTKFIPFRRPAVGEKVTVRYQRENGARFGNTVTVIEE
jgi:hypothetical protein